MAWQDTFIRANQSGWGTASDGETWAHPIGTATLSITSNQGNVTGQSARQIMLLGSQSSGNCEGITQLVTSNGLDNGIGVVLRSNNGATNCYCGQIGATNLVEIVKISGGSSTTLNTTSFTIVGGTAYWLKFRANGSNLYVKSWQVGSAEPSSWQLTTTDTAFTSGQFGLRTFPSSAGVSSQFNNFQVYPIDQKIIGNHKSIGRFY